jgi:hypothetical protein
MGLAHLQVLHDRACCPHHELDVLIREGVLPTVPFGRGQRGGEDSPTGLIATSTGDRHKQRHGRDANALAIEQRLHDHVDWEFPWHNKADGSAIQVMLQ